MKRTTIIAAVLAAFAATPAGAADFAMKAAAPAMAAYNWTGFYLGVTAGGGLQNTVIDDKDCNLSCNSLNMSKAFGSFGGTLGYNYQFGHGVLGIEGDANWTNYSDTLVDPDWARQRGSFHSVKSDWYATVRARFGVALDNVLVYGTGGAAFVDRQVIGRSSTTGVCGGHCFSIDETTVGVVGGVGAEYMIAGPWSAKVEYLHIMTPTKRVRDLDPSAALSAANQYAATTSIDIVRAGINYRFGGPAARY